MEIDRDKNKDREIEIEMKMISKHKNSDGYKIEIAGQTVVNTT